MTSEPANKKLKLLHKHIWTRNYYAPYMYNYTCPCGAVA